MKDLQHSFRNSDEYSHDQEKCEHAGSKKAQRSYKSKEQSLKITTCSTKTNLEESKEYKPESKINSKIARIRFVFSGETSLRGRLAEKAKKQKGDDDKEEEEMKKHMEIVQDGEVAIDAIPLNTKPLMIVEYKIDKEGKIGHFKLIRADGSSKRYSSMIQTLQGIDREDLETLWKLVKAKHGLRRPEEDYERVLWGDLKVMFETDMESKV
ncbi:hypothetical protein Tco_1313823 [Tanacetum coccineum]